MPYARTTELMAGAPRNITLRQRVVKLSQTTPSGQDVTAFHFVTESGLRGLLMVQGWRDHARRLASMASEGKCVEMKSVSIKLIGYQRQWQCSALDCYAAVTGSTQLQVPREDAVRDPDAFLTQLELLLATPFNLHIIITKNPNLRIELVFAPNIQKRIGPF